MEMLYEIQKKIMYIKIKNKLVIYQYMFHKKINRENKFKLKYKTFFSL